MNCCFEDCFVLDSLLEDRPDDWGDVMRRFYELRKPNADAIARLAVANFLEMRSKVVDPIFLRKKKIEASLHEMFPDRWIPLYTMVTFTTIGYADAMRRAREQDELLDRIGLDTLEAAIAAGREETERAVWGEG
jgi:kynurenine 3-monooxygenase